MIRRPPVATRIDTLVTPTTLFRSRSRASFLAVAALDAARRDRIPTRHPRLRAGNRRSTVVRRWSLVAETNPAQRDCHPARAVGVHSSGRPDWMASRSEEHTSELQSLMRISYAVFCLKKKNSTKKD